MIAKKRILPGVPLLLILASFVAGELFAMVSGNVLPYVVLCLVSASICAYWRGRMSVSASALFIALGAYAVAVSVCGGAYSAGMATGESKQYAGRVANVVITPYNQRLTVDLEPSGSRVLVYYHASLPVFASGDIVAFKGVMQPVEGYVAPGEISVRDYAFRNKISARCDLGEGAVSIVGFKDSPSTFFMRLRGSVSDFIHLKSGLDRDAATMLDAVVTGNARELAPEVRNDFSRAGTAHALALSGMHVSVLALIAGVLLFPLRMIGARRLSAAIFIILLWGYVLLAGCTSSVVRTAVMTTVVVVGGMLRRGTNSLNNLCLAALLILLFDPMALFAPGFQLSFAAVAGILLFPVELMPSGKLPPGVRPALQWLLVCLSAVLATAPVSAYYFHNVSLLFLVSNLSVALCLPLFMGSGLLLMLLRWAGFDAAWLVTAVEFVYGIITGTTSRVASLGWSAVDGVYFSAWLLLPCYAAVSALWWWLRTRRLAVLAVSVMCACATVGGYYACKPEYGEAEAYALRYHYATAILLREGDRAWILTDTPPKFYPIMREQMEIRLSDFMKTRGVDSLEVTCSLSGSEYFRAEAGYWALGGKLLVLLGGNTGMANVQDRAMPVPDYAIIGRRYKGGLAAVNADTIVLSKSLYPAVAGALADSLKVMKKPFRIGVEGDIFRR